MKTMRKTFETDISSEIYIYIYIYIESCSQEPQSWKRKKKKEPGEKCQAWRDMEDGIVQAEMDEEYL